MGPRVAANVKAYGAQGDGATDDTPSVQHAVDNVIGAGGGSLYFPAGQYRLTKPVVFARDMPVDVFGDGFSSNLRYEQADDGLRWTPGFIMSQCSVRHLRITSTVANKPPQSAAIKCAGGTRYGVVFSHLWIDAEGSQMDSGIIITGQADTTTIEHCVVWGIHGVGLQLPGGSEVRVLGGRFVGQDPSLGFVAGATGIRLTEGMGGFHLTDTDVVGLEVGMQVGNPKNPPSKSNQWIFITHATFDTSGTGLAVFDPLARVFINGCWAATCKDYQIFVAGSATQAFLTIAGGTIFNGGQQQGNNFSGGRGIGLKADAGTVILTGVAITNNKGPGLQIDDRHARLIMAPGSCLIEGNGG